MVIKNLEKRVRKLFKYLEDYRIPSEKQQGSRKCYSWLTNFLVAREIWCTLKYQKLPVDVAFVDLSEAFDKVPQNQPLYRSSNIRIRGYLLTWIKDFVVIGQQIVRLNSNSSSW